MINNNWRLITGVTVIIPHNLTDSVFITSSENKKFESNLIKSIISIYGKEIGWDLFRIDNSFKVKIEDNKVKIKSPKLPVPENWFIVKNIDYSLLLSAIESVNCNLGEFSDDFEFCFSTSSTSVILVSPKMKEYKSLSSDMRRRFNIQLNRKTKTRLPGHRYDSDNETLYYICELLCRKNNLISSKFIEDPKDCLVAQLYSTTPGKTISEVLKSGVLGENLIVKYSTELMVDSGEVISNDFSGNIQDYWEYMIKNALTQYSSINKYGFKLYKDFVKILNIFTFQSPVCTSYDKVPIDMMKDIIKEYLYQVLVENWNKKRLHRPEIEIGDDKHTYGSLQLLFYSTLKDPNLLKDTYFNDLIEYNLKINVGNLAYTVINEWIELKIDTWENYLKYSTLLVNNSYSIDQRLNKTDLKPIAPKVEKIKDLYPKNLSKTIIELAYEANDCCGYNISKYEMVNIGTTSNPYFYTTYEITIDDLINSGKLTDSIKEEIMKSNFHGVIIKINKGGKIE